MATAVDYDAFFLVATLTANLAPDAAFARMSNAPWYPASRDGLATAPTNDTPDGVLDGRSDERADVGLVGVSYDPIA